ncbi:hypothetical protein [Halegenticoccus tardaugens]|uniref:hypothetical protein n=1 Tax=Halegenticoccus tardaugens TaxID=2071624 RepID=UPI00100C1B57|nr:hypothetical protein [Halegenticoccus tardaugens]
MNDADSPMVDDDAVDSGKNPQHPSAADGSFEIVTQPRTISNDEARKRVMSSFSQKLRSLRPSRAVKQTTLRYKPYFEFKATLRKRIFRGDDDIYHGAIVVDGLTGVARPILKEQVETTVERIPENNVLKPDIDEGTARNRANRNRIKVQQRESGRIELCDEPSLVYKPLWLVELGNDVEVVDATNGQVFAGRLL